MSSASVSAYSALEYREITVASASLPALASSEAQAVEVAPIVTGVPEEEVERRVIQARESGVAETEQRMHAEQQRVREDAKAQLQKKLTQFEQERAEYFKQVETDVLQLALAIVRKILQRETELDRMLLGALVRLALERIQSGPAVRVRVVPEDVEHWRALAGAGDGAPAWEAVGDSTLEPGDCVVETELGSANFGIEAQLRDVEETFAQFLAKRPTSR